MKEFAKGVGINMQDNKPTFTDLLALWNVSQDYDALADVFAELGQTGDEKKSHGLYEAFNKPDWKAYVTAFLNFNAAKEEPRG